jgi:hypothetical protein
VLKKFIAIPSIRAKLTLVLLLTALLGLFLLSLILIVSEKKNATERLVKELTTMADVVAWNSSVNLIFDDKRGAREALASLGQKPDIAFASLYGADGKMYATYQKEEKIISNMEELFDAVLPRGQGFLTVLESGKVISKITADYCYLVRPVYVNDQLEGATSDEHI